MILANLVDHALQQGANLRLEVDGISADFEVDESIVTNNCTHSLHSLHIGIRNQNTFCTEINRNGLHYVFKWSSYTLQTGEYITDSNTIELGYIENSIYQIKFSVPK